MPDTQPHIARPARTIVGHPGGLFVLFFAEMWERFSYYGMRALLVLYLTKHFLFAQEPAYAVYGAYTSLVYIAPILGGYIADRALGARKAVLAGGVFIAIGHLLIALFEEPATPAGGAPEGFYLGLAAIIVGTGFLKANIAVLVGHLYPRADARRDPGFSIFYMGINLGGFLGPIVCGILGERYGWSLGFGAAAVGMLAGLVVFVLFRPALQGAGEPPDPAALRARTPVGLSREWAIYAGGVVLIAAAWWLVRNQGAVGTLLVLSAVLTVGYVLFLAFTRLPAVERHRLFALLFLIALSPLFWALFEQTGSSLSLYIDQRVDRTLFGWNVPASTYQSINSIFIITLAPVFAGLWTWLGRRGLEPSAPAKFGIGLVLVGAGFLALLAGAGIGDGGLTPTLFIVLLYLLHTMGELCFSPVGLAATTRLSIASMAGLMMGTYYLAMAAGNFLAGLIAQATGGEGAGVDTLLAVYGRIGWFSMAVGGVVLVLAPFVKRLMHLDTLGAVDHALAGDPLDAEPGATGPRTDRLLKDQPRD